MVLSGDIAEDSGRKRCRGIVLRAASERPLPCLRAGTRRCLAPFLPKEHGRCQSVRGERPCWREICVPCGTGQEGRAGAWKVCRIRFHERAEQSFAVLRLRGAFTEGDRKSHREKHRLHPDLPLKAQGKVRGS